MTGKKYDPEIGDLGKFEEYVRERDQILSTGTPEQMLDLMDRSHQRGIDTQWMRANPDQAARVFHYARVLSGGVAKDLKILSIRWLQEHGYQTPFREDEL